MIGKQLLPKRKKTFLKDRGPGLCKTEVDNDPARMGATGCQFLFVPLVQLDAGFGQIGLSTCTTAPGRLSAEPYMR